MKRFISGGAIVGAVLLTAGSCATAIAADKPTRRFTLTSSDVSLQTAMPAIYGGNLWGCTGGNQSPPLAWRNAPTGTKSFVLTIFDDNVREDPSGWWHWVVYDLPPSTDHLPAGVGAEHSASLPAGAMQGRTDLGTDAYHGPCPGEGDAPHRYIFTVYALSIAKLDVPPDSSGAMVTAATEGSVLAKATFIMRYGRKKN